MNEHSQCCSKPSTMLMAIQSEKHKATTIAPPRVITLDEIEYTVDQIKTPLTELET